MCISCFFGGERLDDRENDILNGINSFFLCYLIISFAKIEGRETLADKSKQQNVDRSLCFTRKQSSNSRFFYLSVASFIYSHIFREEIFLLSSSSEFPTIVYESRRRR